MRKIERVARVFDSVRLYMEAMEACMVRQLTLVVSRLPEAGALRLYESHEPPCVLPGERLADDPTSWIVEPAPGLASCALRWLWHVLGRWVWACGQLNRPLVVAERPALRRIS